MAACKPGMLLAIVFVILLTVSGAYSKPLKVLAVMSYEVDFPWVKEIREGIDSVFGDKVAVEYFYLNTKIDWNGGKKRAAEAYERFKAMKPDGVIVADDDGQSMFVVPYLKNRVDTPVIFCGVNAAPDIYGYPAANVSGVLEREPMAQSLLFLLQLSPQVKTIATISKESPTAQAVERQLDMEKESYPVRYIGSQKAGSMPEALQIVQGFKASCDALIYITMEGLPDEHGNPLSDSEILPALAQKFGKPVITNALYRVKYGALSAVVKTGQEHGRMAAEMLLKAMGGTPVKDLPVTQNRFGQRIINVDTLNRLNINPKPYLIRSATLVRNER